MKDLSTLERFRDREQERRIYGCNGDGGNGIFKIMVGQRSFWCIASDGGGWEHVSVSPCKHKRKACPTWEEMCGIKDVFFHPEECVVEYHPPKREYVNIHETCLHLWRPTDGNFRMPPGAYV